MTKEKLLELAEQVKQQVNTDTSNWKFPAQYDDEGGYSLGDNWFFGVDEDESYENDDYDYEEVEARANAQMTALESYLEAVRPDNIIKLLKDN